jgi:transposase
LQSVFALAERVTHLAASTLSAKRRTLDRQLGAILATPSRSELTRELQAKISRARSAPGVPRPSRPSRADE